MEATVGEEVDNWIFSISREASSGRPGHGAGPGGGGDHHTGGWCDHVHGDGVCTFFQN